MNNLSEEELEEQEEDKRILKQIERNYKTQQSLEAAAEEFIKKCHVASIVYALEGGVIELKSLLIDFHKLLMNNPNEEQINIAAKEYFNSSCITHKAIHYPTKGFVAGVKWILNRK